MNITCHDIIISMPFAMLMQMPNSGYCGTSTPPCRFNASCCKYQGTFAAFQAWSKLLSDCPIKMATSPSCPSLSVKDRTR